MEADASLGASVKRKLQTEEQLEEVEAKIKKLEDPHIQTSLASDPPSQDNNTQADSTCCDSQCLTGSISLPVNKNVSETNDSTSAQNGTVGVFSSSPKKIVGELNLIEGSVFEDMLNAFSKDSLPTTITYNGRRYDLAPAFEEFWKYLCNSSNFTFGYDLKLLNTELKQKFMLAIARVLKRGWEDQRFFPDKIAPLFLEVCLFNKERNDIEYDWMTFENFIVPSDCDILKKNENNTVNEEILTILTKYYTGIKVTADTKVKTACIDTLRFILYDKTKRVRDVWTPELVGLLELEQFKFLLRNQPIDKKMQFIGEKDMCTTAPHRIWKDFFYQWDDNTVNFYIKLIENKGELRVRKCIECNKPENLYKKKSGKEKDEKHFLNQCEDKKRSMYRERHDCVLKQIVKELMKSVENRSAYFSTAKDWKRLIMYCNYNEKPWPQEINFLKRLELYPHIVAYTTNPIKKALVVEITVSWEYYVQWNAERRENNERIPPKYDKILRYKPFVESLEQNGFETKFCNVEIGSRGALSYDLYELCADVLGMDHASISKLMKKISTKIIKVAYNDYCLSVIK